MARDPGTCGCGLPFGLLAAIEGRAEDIMQLAAPGGGAVSVHPNVFHRVLEPVPARAWQVIQEPARLRVLIVGPHAELALDRLAGELARELRAAGADPPRIDVEIAEAVTRTPLGKAPLVRALRDVSVHGPAERI